MVFWKQYGSLENGGACWNPEQHHAGVGIGFSFQFEHCAMDSRYPNAAGVGPSSPLCCSEYLHDWFVYGGVVGGWGLSWYGCCFDAEPRTVITMICNL